jgi:SAM-dependent methyltransferase
MQRISTELKSLTCSTHCGPTLAVFRAVTGTMIVQANSRHFNQLRKTSSLRFPNTKANVSSRQAFPMRDKMPGDPGPPSKELLKLAGELSAFGNGVVLDAGCGYGRNAIALACSGLSVVCVDQDFKRLKVLIHLAHRHIASGIDRKLGQVWPMQAKLGPSSWPFGRNCFVDIALFEAFRSSLVEGGYLYIETFGGQGGNYLGLPKAGELKARLQEDFHIQFYREKKVGPAGCDAVTVKLAAKKFRSPPSGHN